MLLLAIATLALGLALLIPGLRGRRIDDHPICRKCKFDLVGLTSPERQRRATSEPQAAAGGAELLRCPECGRDLSARSAIRHGARRRRPAAIIIGLVLAVAGLSVTGVITWGRAASYDWNKVKPEWLLLREAGAARPESRVVMELWRRWRGQRLSTAHRQQLLDLALAVQADPAIPWDYHWGLIIELGRERGLVRDQQWVVFARNARGSLSQNSDVPFSRYSGVLCFQPVMGVGAGRGGLSTTLKKRHRLIRLIVNGRDAAIPADWPERGPNGFQLGIPGGFKQLPLPVPECRGETAIEAFWTVEIVDGLAKDPNRPLAAWPEHFTGTWSVDQAEAFPVPPGSGEAGVAGFVPLQAQPIQKQQPPPR